MTQARASIDLQTFRSRDQFISIGDALHSMGGEIDVRGWRTVALLVSHSAEESGVAGQVRAALPSSCTVNYEHVGIGAHSPAEDTERIADAMRDNPPDVLLTVGGGKVSDTAKGISLLLSNKGSLVEFCTTFKPPDTYWAPPGVTARIPVAAVPTTLAGAELTPGGGARTPNGEKRAFWAPEAAARVAAYDVAILRLTPASVLGGTGMNALAHCVEGSYSRTHSIVTDALARTGASRLLSGLNALANAVIDDGAMIALAEGAVLGGLVISNARTGLHHALCHVVGARFGATHGDANAVLLPAVVRFNTEAASTELTELASVALGDGATPEDLAVRIEEVRSGLQVPTRLADLGLEEGDLRTVAEAVMSERGLHFNPRRVEGPDQILSILRSSW